LPRVRPTGRSALPWFAGESKYQEFGGHNGQKPTS